MLARLAYFTLLTAATLGCSGAATHLDQTAITAHKIEIDGSSTVYPITQLIAKRFQEIQPSAIFDIKFSGTGSGLKRFCGREITIAAASRPINSKESDACQTSKVTYEELAIAYDAITVVVPRSNTWAKSISTAELKRIWEPEASGKVRTWHDIRSSWPKKPLRLFGPHSESGTFDYFSLAIVGTEGKSRVDFAMSEDDEVIAKGVSSDSAAMGYFGFSYFKSHLDKLKALPINDENDANGKGPIEPTSENVINGLYQPLSRPLLLYVARSASNEPLIDEFVKFFIAQARDAATQVKSIPLPEAAYQVALNRYLTHQAGSAFGGAGSRIGVSINDLLNLDLAELMELEVK